MYIDAQGKFSDGQALTASAVSSNVVDLGGDYNLGIGEPMAVVLVVDAAADGTDRHKKDPKQDQRPLRSLHRQDHHSS